MFPYKLVPMNMGRVRKRTVNFVCRLCHAVHCLRAVRLLPGRPPEGTLGRPIAG